MENAGGEEVRQSPDGKLVAIKHPGELIWRVSNGGHYRDIHVHGWTVLVAAPSKELVVRLSPVDAVKRCAGNLLDAAETIEAAGFGPGTLLGETARLWRDQAAILDRAQAQARRSGSGVATSQRDG